MRRILLAGIASMSISAVAAAEHGGWNAVQSWVYQLCNYRNGHLQEIAESPYDLAVIAGYDGAYLDMVTTYEEIPETGMLLEVRARQMVDLIDRISQYAKSQRAGFKIVPQNGPELYTWSYWTPRPNRKYWASCLMSACRLLIAFHTHQK